MRQLSILLWLITLPTFIYAQRLSGRVTDQSNGKPLENALIQVAGSKLSTVSDDKGNYHLELDSGTYKIKVSFLGYQSQTKQVSTTKGSVVIDFPLTRETYEQDQVIVSASRSEVNKFSIPISVSSIGSKQLEEQAESNVLPILSGRIPGMFVTQRGYNGFGVSTGSAGQITIRGVGASSSSQVMVMIDGQPQFQGIFGHHFPDNYVSSDIEKVEVIRGPASLVYGTNAMGGVVNIISKKQKREGLSLNSTVQYGSYNTQKYALSTGYKKDKLSIFLSGNYDTTDGDRENSDFNIRNGYTKISYQLSDQFQLTTDFSINHFKAYDPGPIYAPDPSEYANKSHWVDINRRNFSVLLTNNTGPIKGGIRAYHNYGDHEIYDGWTSIDENFGFSLYQGANLFKGNQTTIGIDYKQYGGIGSPIVGAIFVDGKFQGIGPSPYNNKWISIKEKALYVVSQQNLTAKLSLNAGVRFEDHSIYDTEVIPQVGLNYQFTPHMSYRLLASKGFRSPNIRELYLFPPANDQLQPENMWNYETGFQKYWTEHNRSLAVTLFYSKGDNLIQTVPNPNKPPQYLNLNTGSFENKGFELEYKEQLTEKLNATVTYSFLDTKEHILAAPEQQLFIGLNYQLKKFTFNANTQWVQGLYTNIMPDNVQQEDYFVVNCKVNYHISPKIRLFIYGENLTDTSYEINYGYPLPGISAISGIQISL
ncbi:TonB-dependent receptor [Puteibacter caeruleilacunae]|nr:TonB-dependent receptor [Puteibacter caeruleilacunae]